jgi:hypothetical protein
MTLCNFNLPLDLPLELAIDAVSDYSPTPTPFATAVPWAEGGVTTSVRGHSNPHVSLYISPQSQRAL